MTNSINTDKQTKELAVRGNKQLPIIETSGNTIKNLIYVVRGQQVMPDSDLAYHIGASVKDAGKKCFGINQIKDRRIVKDILERLKIESK